MLVEARIEPLGQVERAQPEEVDLSVDVLELAVQHLVPRGGQHAVVQLDGSPRVALEVPGAERSLQLSEALLERRSVLGREGARRQAGGQALERAADGEEVHHPLHAEVEDEHPLARDGLEKPLALEPPHGLPDGRAADAQLPAELLDVQLGARREDLAQDQVADRLVDSITEAFVDDRGDEWRQLHQRLTLAEGPWTVNSVFR
jgi:hypothetical protein